MTPSRLRSVQRLIFESPKAKAAALTELLERVEVTDDDIRSFRLGDPNVCADSPRVLAWCQANGIELTDSGAIKDLNCSAMAHDWIINGLAAIVERPPLVVLGEIAKAK